MNDVKALLKCDRCHGPLDSISRIYSCDYDDYEVEIVCSKCYDKHELNNLQERIKSLRSQIREKQKYLKCVKGGGHYFEEPDQILQSLNHLQQIKLFDHRYCSKCGFGDDGNDTYHFMINDTNILNVDKLEFKMPEAGALKILDSGLADNPLKINIK